jgi:hypothetical protein
MLVLQSKKVRKLNSLDRFKIEGALMRSLLGAGHSMAQERPEESSHGSNAHGALVVTSPSALGLPKGHRP